MGNTYSYMRISTKEQLGKQSYSRQIAALEKLKASSTSGSVKASLPEDPGFKANLDSTSGRITCSLPLIKQGNDYICGEGSGAVDISTTSGNITITALKG